MGHGGFANPPTGTRPVPSGGTGLGLAREGLPLHLHISAAAEQGSYASQERVTKPVSEVWIGVERNAIASEENTSGKYHKVQLRTLCACLWVLRQELGCFKKNTPV